MISWAGWDLEVCEQHFSAPCAPFTWWNYLWIAPSQSGLGSRVGMAVVTWFSTLRGWIPGFSDIFETVRGELQVIWKVLGIFCSCSRLFLQMSSVGSCFPPFPSPRMHLGKVMQSRQVSCTPGVISGYRSVGLGQSKKLSCVLFSILHFQGAGTVHLWTFLSCIPQQDSFSSWLLCDKKKLSLEISWSFENQTNSSPILQVPNSQQSWHQGQWFVSLKGPGLGAAGSCCGAYSGLQCFGVVHLLHTSKFEVLRVGGLGEQRHTKVSI